MLGCKEQKTKNKTQKLEAWGIVNGYEKNLEEYLSIQSLSPKRLKCL